LTDRDDILAAVAAEHRKQPFAQVDRTVSTVGTAAMVAAGLAPFGVLPSDAAAFAREVGDAIQGMAAEIRLDTPYGPATIATDGDVVTLMISDDEVLTRGIDHEQLDQDNMTLWAVTA